MGWKRGKNGRANVGRRRRGRRWRELAGTGRGVGGVRKGELGNVEMRGEDISETGSMMADRK